MMPAPSDTAQLLHTLGYLYCRDGQVKRGLVLLLIAVRLAPRDPGILKTLAYAFLCDHAGRRALQVIERLQALDHPLEPRLALLESKALWLTGREGEARRCLRAFIASRGEHCDAR